MSTGVRGAQEVCGHALVWEAAALGAPGTQGATGQASRRGGQKMCLDTMDSRLWDRLEGHAE